MYNDGRITSEASIVDLPLSNSPPSGDMKRMAMRIAKITSVDKAGNTVKLQWLWPQRGGIDNVDLTRPYVGLRSGINFMPEVGSVVVVGYAFNIPVILSYVLPAAYKKMLAGELDNNDKPTNITEINPGELLLYSAQGSEIYVHDQIELKDNAGDNIVIDPGTGTILMDSLNWNVINESGNFYMGMVKRVVNGTSSIITNDGQSILNTSGGKALTELKINIKEFATNSINDNQSNPNIATVTIGTLVDANGKKVLNEIGNQIVLDVSFASGANLQIDKSGHFNFNGGKMTKPTQATAPNIDPLSIQNKPVFKPLLSAQNAARNGDFISIPVVTSTDADHPAMNQIAVANLQELASKLAPFFRVFGAHPCVYTSGPPINLMGQIVTGSSDVFIGSKDEKI